MPPGRKQVETGALLKVSTPWLPDLRERCYHCLTGLHLQVRRHADAQHRAKQMG